MTPASAAAQARAAAKQFWDEFQTADGLFVVDGDHRISYWSDGAQRMMGVKAKDILGKLCYEAVGGRDARNRPFCRSDCPVMTTARRGRPTPNYDIRCTLPSGEERWFNISVAVPKGGRAGAQVVHFLRDVTQHRHAETFALKAGRALRSLMADGHASAEEEDIAQPPPAPKLSRREMDVLRLLAAGMTTQQIAENLTIKPVTARNHIARLLARLGVANRLQAVVYATEHRLV